MMGSWWMIASSDFLRQTPRAPPYRGRRGKGAAGDSRARGRARATLAAAVPMRHCHAGSLHSGRRRLDLEVPVFQPADAIMTAIRGAQSRQRAGGVA